MPQCSQSYDHRGKTYKCVRAVGHGPCVPTFFMEDGDHHLVFGIDIETHDGKSHRCIVTAAHNADGTITVIGVDEWDEVHPPHVPSGE